MKKKLPTGVTLLTTRFEKPDKNHSFIQETSGETILFFVLKSGYVDLTTPTQPTSNCSHSIIETPAFVHPIIPHLLRMIKRLSTYDFTWIRTINTEWDSQQSISDNKQITMMACIFHYNVPRQELYWSLP